MILFLLGIGTAFALALCVALIIGAVYQAKWKPVHNASLFAQPGWLNRKVKP